MALEDGQYATRHVRGERDVLGIMLPRVMNHTHAVDVERVGLAGIHTEELGGDIDAEVVRGGSIAMGIDALGVVRAGQDGIRIRRAHRDAADEGIETVEVVEIPSNAGKRGGEHGFVIAAPAELSGIARRRTGRRPSELEVDLHRVARGERLRKDHARCPFRIGRVRLDGDRLSVDLRKRDVEERSIEHEAARRRSGLHTRVDRQCHRLRRAAQVHGDVLRHDIELRRARARQEENRCAETEALHRASPSAMRSVPPSAAVGT